jgi:hypothetical protein
MDLKNISNCIGFWYVLMHATIVLWGENMKKVVSTCVVFIFIAVSAFAMTESWTSVGYEKGMFLELDGDDTNYTMQSEGIGSSSFTFAEGSDSGLYFHGSFMLPTTGTKTQNGNTTEVDYSQFDFISQIGIVIGPGFRNRISGGVSTYCGLGLSVMQLAGYYENGFDYYGILGYSFGFGGEIGLKVDLSDALYLGIGVVGTYEFKSYTTISSTLTGTNSNWSDDYSLFSARPYIMIGFNSFNKTATIGKPTK